MHGDPAPGDVRDSLAASKAAHAAFGFDADRELEDGLSVYIDWLRDDPVTAGNRGRPV